MTTTILDRYIVWSLIRGWLLVLAVLAAIFGLLAFVDEFGRINNHYNTIDALRYIGLTMPQRIVELMPAIALLGTLIALASMSKHSELIVIWSSGMRLRRFMRPIGLLLALLVASLLLLTEWVIPPVYQQAEAQRAIAQSGSANLLTGQGLWSANGTRFTNIRTFQWGHIPKTIIIYQFNPEGRLLSSIHADYAHISSNRRWVLFNVERTELNNGKPVTQHFDHLDMESPWLEREIPGLSLSSTGLSLSALYAYTAYLQSIDQPYQRYQLAFWQQLLLPFNVAAMVLLAIPISIGLGSPRSHSFEKRMAIGAVIGILFYLSSPIIYGVGSLLKLYAPWVAITPGIITIIVAGLLFKRCKV